MRWGWSLGFGFSQILFVIVCHSLPFSLSVPNYNRLKITTDFHFCIWGAGVPWKSRKEYFPNIVWTLDNGQHPYLFIFRSLPIVNHTVVPLMFEEKKYLERALKVSKGQHTTRRRHSWRPESKGDLLHHLPIVFGKQISCCRPVFDFCLMIILSSSQCCFWWLCGD